MDLRFSEADETFRADVRAWLEGELCKPEWSALRGRGGPGDEHALHAERLAWNQHLANHGWSCVGWPERHGGLGLSLMQEVIFNEEYARAGGPGRVGHIGETLLGPTLIAFGTEDQKARFLPPILSGQELWAQGYSEPNAGSDLANVQTKAELDGDEWVVTGQKTWTSHAEWSDWAFVLCRTNFDVSKHRGISYLLVPLKQPGVDIRPIAQLTGTSEFSEVFFDGARTPADHVVGPVDGGWKVAMATLAFERGASTLGQQLAFASELAEVIEVAGKHGSLSDPLTRDRLARAWMELRVMRLNALRTLTANAGELTREAMINKLYWANWHRDLGELAMDVMGQASQLLDHDQLTRLQRLFLFSRSDTIYAGSNQIQRNIIGERALGLPKEPRP
jgi:alkylation response protein AidB-like acyl-CoA dehydrogenase